VLAQRRLRLDQVLWNAARSTPGVRAFEDAPVEGAVVTGGRAVGLKVGGDIRRGGLVVGADGIESPVRRSLGLDQRPAESARVGARVHFRLPLGRPGPERLEIFIGRGHELYAAPLPGGEVLLAALCDRSELAGGAGPAFERWIAAEPLLAAWLEGATPISEPAGRAPVTRRARAGFAPGAVLLGDAASATDPLTAGGIAHALVTAERLAAYVPRILAHGDAHLAAFDRERSRLLAPHDRLTAALVYLVGRPTLARATMRGMRLLPRLMRTLLGIGGGISIQPPRLATTAASSAIPAIATRATDQKAMLDQRLGSP
jgi:2-polyprenyl-6-methoxyphenol hydroxylase-like FAD-dependent oxidoreductase